MTQSALSAGYIHSRDGNGRKLNRGKPRTARQKSLQIGDRYLKSELESDKEPTYNQVN